MFFSLGIGPMHRETDVECGLDECIHNDNGLCDRTYINLYLEKDDDEFELDLMGWDFQLIPRGDGWYRLEYDLFGFIPLKMDWVAEVSVAPVTMQGKYLLLTVRNCSRLRYPFPRRILIWRMRKPWIIPCIIWLPEMG